MTRFLPLESDSKLQLPKNFPTLAGRAVARRRRLEDRAQALVVAGDLEAALGLLTAAAEIGWLDHSGDFFSFQMEGLLAAIGESAGGWPSQSPRSGLPHRVLHVLTEAYAVGGHTRLTWRWIEQQHDVRHDVVLTQHAGSVPVQLLAAVKASGGEVIHLTGTRLARLRALRHSAARADVVILNVHPFDVTSISAVAHSQRAVPVLLLNHADHVFWPGGSVADRVVCLRPSGFELSRTRRGIHPDRLDLLPIPLTPRAHHGERSHARRNFKPSLLSVASPHKFVPFQGETLATLVAAVLEADPRVTFTAIGPRAGDPVWASLERTHAGRVRLLGHVNTSIETFEEASVYLDSYPLASYTSWLDAASAGVPVVSYRPPWVSGTTLAADDPAEANLLVAGDPTAWVQCVTMLLGDAALAFNRGDRLRRDILDAHCRRWPAAVTALLEGATVLPADERALADVEVGANLTDAVVARGHRMSGLVRPVADVLRQWSTTEVFDAHEVLGEVTPEELRPYDLSVVLVVFGGRAEVERGLNTVETSFSEWGRLDVRVVSSELQADGLAALQEAIADDRCSVEVVDDAGAVGRGAWEASLAHAKAPWVVAFSADVQLTAAVVSACMTHLLDRQGNQAVVPQLVDGSGADRAHGAIGDSRGVCLFFNRDRLLAGELREAVTAPGISVELDQA